MRRFAIQPATGIDKENIDLSHEESRHITKILRLQPGLAIELYDGTGFLYQASITEVGKTVRVHIHSKQYFEPPQPALILHTGLLKNKKMELVLQKATELGVAEVQLFISDHTSVSLPDQKKMARYEKIIQESCKQCERIHLMKIRQVTPLSTQLKATEDSNQSYLFWEREQSHDPSAIGDIDKSQPIHLFTGPEGGFSSAEISALASNIKTISLGRQILRAETAVITAVAVVSYLAGRLKP